MEQAATGIVTAFLQYGVVGAIAVIALWGYWQKDKALHACRSECAAELKLERDARLSDGKEMLKMYYELQSESEKTLETAVNLILKQQKDG